MIVLNVSRSLTTEKGALFQRNCPVCQDKKEAYIQQRKGTAATEHYQGRGCKTNHQWEKG